jgi:protein TonB
VQPHAAAPSAPIAAFTAGAPGDRPEALGGGIPSPSAGTRGSGEPGVGSAIHANYFDALFLKIVDALDYPRRARLEEIEGTVVLDLRIDRSGRLAHGAIALSSGSRLLDRHALRIARRAAPFGPVPEALEDSELSFELPVEFQLED